VPQASPGPMVGAIDPGQRSGLSLSDVSVLAAAEVCPVAELRLTGRR
jgi:hypothetical protein